LRASANRLRAEAAALDALADSLSPSPVELIERKVDHVAE
jgi:hypothetical protein